MTNGLDSTVMELRRAFDDLVQKTMIFRLPEDIFEEEEISKEYLNALDNIYFNIERIDKAKKVLISMKETQFKL